MAVCDSHREKWLFLFREIKKGLKSQTGIKNDDNSSDEIPEATVIGSEVDNMDGSQVTQDDRNGETNHKVCFSCYLNCFLSSISHRIFVLFVHFIQGRGGRQQEW